MSLLFEDSVVGEMVRKQKKRVEDSGKIWVKIANTKTIKSYIISLNTWEQLYDKGIDSKGVSLKEIGGNDFTLSGYAPTTIERKKRKGGISGRTANITLYDTGDFYKSFSVKITKKGFELKANPQKDDGNLYDDWGEDIVGLTVESLDKLVELLIIKYIEYTRNVIFAD